MFKSLIMAFSTYSRVPMPKVKWNDKYMKYIMCFFPFVGAFIGACQIAVIYVYREYLKTVNAVVVAAIVTVLPILITGGIHMDGFMDTVDAKSSYKPREEKLKILKDPHAGAFAIIYGIVYFLLYFAFSYQLILGDEICTKQVLFGIGFILSRILSGLSVMFFPKAKKDGMVAGTKEMSDDKAKPILIIELLACILLMAVVDIWLGLGMAAVGMLVFLYYYIMSKKVFGGVTGDLAGFFLQVCELGIIIYISVV